MFKPSKSQVTVEACFCFEKQEFMHGKRPQKFFECFDFSCTSYRYSLRDMWGYVYPTLSCLLWEMTFIQYHCFICVWDFPDMCARVLFWMHRRPGAHHVPWNKNGRQLVSCHMDAENWAGSSGEQPVLLTAGHLSSLWGGLFFYFMCMCVLSTCMCIYHRSSWCPPRLEKVLQSPRTGWMGACESPRGWWELNPLRAAPKLSFF